MVRIVKDTDPKKLAELKKKIDDKKYLENAIITIANALTKEIFQMGEE